MNNIIKKRSSFIIKTKLRNKDSRGSILSICDIAAGIIIIRESGGIVTGIDGSEEDLYNGNLVAGNEIIHNSLIEKIKNIYLQDK